MTAAATRPLAWEILERALGQRRPVRLTYHGRQRSVCPHALGWKNDKAMLLAYQSAGQAQGDLPAEPRQGWRNLFVDDISDITLADAATPWESAPNYDASHPFNAIDRLSVAVT
ncbi:MAG: WYL domain-containing protein [Pseudonocardiaceae bacterium]